jgi:hypothetical protein
MIDLKNIQNSHLLIENNHLNFYNIKFDDESLLNFTKNINSFIRGMVDNICYSQEFTDYQKEIMYKYFPNLSIINQR